MIFTFPSFSRWCLKFHSSMNFGFFWWPSYFHSGTGYPWFCQLSRNKSHCEKYLWTQTDSPNFFLFFLNCYKMSDLRNLLANRESSVYSVHTASVWCFVGGGTGLISWQLAALSIVFLVRLTKTLVFLRGACGRQCRDCATVIHWSVSVKCMKPLHFNAGDNVLVQQNTG